MSVLTGPEIERQIELGAITVEPYDRKWVGPNSLDLHLDDLHQYQQGSHILDPSNLPPLEPVPKDGDGFWLLSPGRVYLGVTTERVGCHGFTWMLGLRSSAGRLGIDSLAGVGDDGFVGRITVELVVAQPLWLKHQARLFQLTFFGLMGGRRPYTGRYQNATDVEPSKLKEGS